MGRRFKDLAPAAVNNILSRALLAALILASVTTAAAQTVGPMTANNLAVAMNETIDAVDTLDTLNTAATDALAGRRVTANTKWSDLGTRFRKAAHNLSTAAIPPEMPNPQPVSANELANCSTRPAAIAKLNSYLRDMQQTRLHDSQQVQAMDRQLARIEIAKQQLAYLIGVHEELMKVPIYGHLFVWDWFDLNTDVRDSLAELESAVQSDRKTYLDRSNNLVQRLIILQGNLDLLQQCLGGTWEGDGNPVSLVRHEEPRLRVPEDSDCLITTIRNGVHMRIAARSDGVVTEASVWLHFDQTDQPPGCSNLGVPQPISANLAFGGRILPHDAEATITGNTVHAIMYYPHPPSKPPEESAEFNGNISAARLQGTLTVKFAGQSTIHQIH